MQSVCLAGSYLHHCMSFCRKAYTTQEAFDQLQAKVMQLERSLLQQGGPQANPAPAPIAHSPLPMPRPAEPPSLSVDPAVSPYAHDRTSITGAYRAEPLPVYRHHDDPTPYAPSQAASMPQFEVQNEDVCDILRHKACMQTCWNHLSPSNSDSLFEPEPNERESETLCAVSGQGFSAESCWWINDFIGRTLILFYRFNPLSFPASLSCFPVNT